MSGVAEQADYRIELIDQDLKTRAVLDEAHGVGYPLALYGQGKTGALALHVDSVPARMIRDEEGSWYIRIYRKGVYLRAFVVDTDDYGYEPNTEKEDDYLRLTLAPAEKILEAAWGLPDLSGGGTPLPFYTPELPLDDAMKWIVEYAAGPSAFQGVYGDPRSIYGLTVEAYSSSHPESRIVQGANRKNIYEFLVDQGIAWGIDFSLDLVESTGDDNIWVFRTYYPRRGSDKSEGSPTPVILNDSSLNVISGRRHRNNSFVTTVINRALTEEVTDAALEAIYGRREAIADTNIVDDLEAMLSDNRQRRGFEYQYHETPNCQIIDHFVPGDLVTINSLQLGMDPENRLIREIFVTLPPNEEEKIEITFGDYERSLDSQKGGGPGTSGDKGAPIIGLTDDAGDLVPFSDDDPSVIQLLGINGASVVKTGDHQLSIDGSGWWSRGVIGGATTGLYTKETGDPVIIGADTTPNIGSWLTSPYGGGLGTKLEVLGQLALDRYVYSPGASLVAGGFADGYFKLHVGDAATPIGWFDVNDDSGAAFFRVVADEDIASWFKTSLYIYNGLTFAVFPDTGANPNFRVEGDTGNTFWEDAAQMTWEGTPYRMPTSAPSTAGRVLGYVSGTTPHQLGWLDPGGYWKRTGTVLEPVTAGDYVKATRFYTGTADYLYSSSDGEIRVVGANYSVLYGGTGFLAVSSSAVYPKDSLDLGILTTNDFNDGYFVGRVYAGSFQVRADCYVGSHANTYLNLYASGYVSFVIGGSFMAFVGNFDSANALFPSSGVAFDVGTTSRRIRHIQMSGTITIGGDVNLYRSGANILYSDDTLNALGLISRGDVLFYGDGSSNRSLANHRHSSLTGYTDLGSPVLRASGGQLYWDPATGTIGYYGPPKSTPIYVSLGTHAHSIATPYG